MNKNLSDEKIPIKNICEFNIVSYSECENAILSNSYPIVGVVINDKCYDILKDEYYNILTVENVHSKKYVANEKYAYIFRYPFSGIDKKIDLEYLIREMKEKNNILDIKLFDVSKICKFGYKLNRNFKTSIGYFNPNDKSIHDFMSNKKIEKRQVGYKFMQYRKSKDTISMYEVNKILKLEQKKTF